MEWGFLWLMLVLKIPLIALLWIVWWAIHAVDDPASTADEDGGSAVDQGPRPPALPNRPRSRGPHGEPQPPSPPRVRTPAAQPRVLRD